MEFASFYNSLGTKVTVVEMLPEILGGLDLEISAMLRNIYAKKGIDFHLNAKVVQIDGNKVIFENDGKPIRWKVIRCSLVWVVVP